MTASGLIERLRRPRTLVLLALLVLVIGVRIALPTIVRDVAVSQADAALVGRIAPADVELSMLRGGVTLHGLEVYADELPAPRSADAAADADAPSKGAGAPASEPLATIGSLWVRIGWLPLLRKTVDVAEIQLDDFVVHLDRAQDGALVLPRPVPREAPVAVEPPQTEDGPGWGVLVTSVRLRNGLVGFRDFAADPEPKPFELAIEDVTADNLRLTMGNEKEQPGHLTLQAKIGAGSFELDSQVTMLAAGPRADSKIALHDLPIQGTRVYLKALGWSEVSGTLDAQLQHLFETGGSHTASGTLALRDLGITVPDLEGPALAWKRLDVAVGDVDVVARRAEVSSVVLDGLRVQVRPNEPGKPFPLLQKMLAGEETPSGKPPPPAAPPAEGAGDAAWAWRVNEVRVTDATLDLLREGQPTAIGLTAGVKALSSDPSARTDLSVTLTPPEGSLNIAGGVVQQPLGFDGKLRIEALSLPKLLAPIDQPAAALVRGGVLDTDLGVAVGPPSGAGEKAARISGSIGLAGIDVAEPEPAGDAFGLAWKSLTLDIREVVVPAALGGAAAAPILATIDRVKLVETDVRVTRTGDGIVLPAAFGGKTTAAAPPEGAAAAPVPSTVDVRIAQATIERGRVQVEDRAVRPTYRNEIKPLNLRATGIRWPGPAIDKLRLDAETSGGAKLTVDGSMRGGATEVTAKVDGLPLAPFNPYAAGTGYGVGGGAASLESKFSMKGDAYHASGHIVLSRLAVTGDQGEALFQRQFGVPPSLALALLTDLAGNISLEIPVSGDRSGTSIDLASIVGQALAKAILGALTSPLKMIMAIGTAGGKVESATPQAIQFRPGRAQLARGGEELLDQLAALLGRSPGLRIEVQGRAGADDERWLREQALRSEIEDSSGVMGSLFNVGELGEREVVMPVLEKRAQDETAEIPAEVKDWFEARVAEQHVSAGQIAGLAAARADLVRAALVEQHVASERVVVAPADASTTGSQAPEVALSLGAMSGASLSARASDTATPPSP